MEYRTFNPTNAARGAVATIQNVEAEAVTFARQNRGSMTPSLYVAGGQSAVTKERAYAAALEANPEAYARYRAQHNAGHIISTLEAAGYTVRR